MLGLQEAFVSPGMPCDLEEPRDAGVEAAASEVVALLEASRTAPTYGVNGRELVLRAAAKAVAQACLLLNPAK